MMLVHGSCLVVSLILHCEPSVHAVRSARLRSGDTTVSVDSGGGQIDLDHMIEEPGDSVHHRPRVREITEGKPPTRFALSLLLMLLPRVQQVITGYPWDAVVLQAKPSTFQRPDPEFAQSLPRFAQWITATHARPVLWSQYRMHNVPVGGQATLDSNVATVATETGMTMAPISVAWTAVGHADRTVYRSLYYDLSNQDDPNDHPSPTGSYLIALVLYHVITGQSPIGLPDQAGVVPIPTPVAALLQQTAARGQP